MAKIYPDTKRLFDNLKGRKARYSPEDLADEFKKYIADLEEHQIEVETTYRYQSEESGRRQQNRTQKFARPPKILDFVTRWLGMTHQWWYTLPNGRRGADYAAVIERIKQYCYDVKFDGAVCGFYNANIIARDLGLKDNIAVTRNEAEDNMSIEEVDAEIKRLEKLDK